MQRKKNYTKEVVRLALAKEKVVVLVIVEATATLAAVIFFFFFFCHQLQRTERGRGGVRRNTIVDMLTSQCVTRANHVIFLLCFSQRDYFGKVLLNMIQITPNCLVRIKIIYKIYLDLIFHQNQTKIPLKLIIEKIAL